MFFSEIATLCYKNKSVSMAMELQRSATRRVTLVDGSLRINTKTGD